MKKQEISAILLYFCHSIDGNYIIRSEDFDILIERLSSEKPKKTEEQKQKDVESLLKHEGVNTHYYCSKCKLNENNNFFVQIESLKDKHKYSQKLECELSENELPKLKVTTGNDKILLFDY